MKMVVMFIGGAIFLFGLADVIGSFAGVDLWGQYIGVQLPEVLWKYSAYIEMLIGYFVFKAGKGLGDEPQEAVVD